MEGPVLDDFAKGLENALFNVYSDSFDVLKTYGGVASEAARKSFDVDPQLFANTELETRLWMLVTDLYGYRLSPKQTPPKIYSFSGDAVIQEKFYRETPSSAEKWIILNWLQSGLQSPEQPELVGSKWMHTKDRLRKSKLPTSGMSFQFNVPKKSSNLAPKKNEDVITNLDADAPFRQKKSIASEDEEVDHRIYKYIFELLFTSKIEEALQVCESTGNLTLKMAIRGSQAYVDPDIDFPALDGTNSEAPMAADEASDGQGIERQALWRRMCYQMVQQPNHMGSYERAIYGFLCSDLPSVLKLCESWETQFIAYLRSATSGDAEEPLREAGRLDPQLDSLPAPKSDTTTTTNILDALFHSSNPIINKQSKNLLRTLMGAVINNVVDIIVDQLAAELQKIMEGDTSNEELINSPFIVRVTTHLVIFLQKQGIPAGKPESVATVIRSYIEFLCNQGKSHLAPIYVSYLPPQDAINTYSYLLSNVIDEEVQKKHLQLGKKYKLDMENTVRAAVERVFDASVREYELATGEEVLVTPEVAPTDKKLVGAVQWFVVSGLWADAIHSAVHLYRRFLAAGRVASAKEFGTKISIGPMLKRYDATTLIHDTTNAPSASRVQLSDEERNEIMEYDRFVGVLNQLEAWKRHYESRPHSGSSKAWQFTALKLLEPVVTSIYDLSESWLTGVLDSTAERDEATWSILNRSRTIYVPYLLIELARVLIEAREVHQKFLKQAVELANLVADEHNQLYKLFIDCGNLQEFMSIITNAFTEAIVDGEQGVYE
ncbi:nucleoporin Nup84p [Trichomonascus vanleenenianus]|uniref:Nup84p n=1 Tax=Trichomonascus vanleenenianus TaxID=2268995 RepID=UPI003ECA8B3C